MLPFKDLFFFLTPLTVLLSLTILHIFNGEKKNLVFAYYLQSLHKFMRKVHFPWPP